MHEKGFLTLHTWDPNHYEPQQGQSRRQKEEQQPTGALYSLALISQGCIHQHYTTHSPALGERPAPHTDAHHFDFEMNRIISVGVC